MYYNISQNGYKSIHTLIEDKRYIVPTFEESLEYRIHNFLDDVPPEELYRLLHKLPNKVRYSTVNVTKGDKEHKIRLDKRIKAVLEASHIAVNNQLTKYYIAIDIDKAINIEDLKLTPTWFIQNEDGSGVHLLYELTVPVSTKNPKAMKWYKNLRKGLTEVLGGDEHYSDVIVKSPFYPFGYKRIYNGVTYTFRELDNFLKESGYSKRYKKASKNRYWHFKGAEISEYEISQVQRGTRNVSLFNIVRKYAYTLDHLSASLFDDISDYAVVVNSLFPEPLRDGEVNDTSRSIHGYVSEGKHLKFIDNKDRGVCTRLGLIDKNMDMRERQRVGAIYTNTKQRMSVEKNIERAIQSLVFDFDRDPNTLLKIDIAREMARLEVQNTEKRAKAIANNLSKGYREHITQLLFIAYIEYMKMEVEGLDKYNIDWNSDSTDSLEERVQEIYHILTSSENGVSGFSLLESSLVSSLGEETEGKEKKVLKEIDITDGVDPP
jgi:hypothetical protein